MILTPLQKLPKNWGDWGKLIVANGFKKLPKVQLIAKSGHTACDTRCLLLKSSQRFLLHNMLTALKRRNCLKDFYNDIIY